MSRLARRQQLLREVVDKSLLFSRYLPCATPVDLRDTDNRDKAVIGSSKRRRNVLLGRRGKS